MNKSIPDLEVNTANKTFSVDFIISSLIHLRVHGKDFIIVRVITEIDIYLYKLSK